MSIILVANYTFSLQTRIWLCIPSYGVALGICLDCGGYVTHVWSHQPSLGACLLGLIHIETCLQHSLCRSHIQVGSMKSVLHHSPGQRFGTLAICSVHISNTLAATPKCGGVHGYRTSSNIMEQRMEASPKAFYCSRSLAVPLTTTHSHTHFRLGSLDVHCNHSVLQKKRLTTEQHCSTVEYATQHTLSQGYIQAQTSAAERKSGGKQQRKRPVSREQKRWNHLVRTLTQAQSKSYEQQNRENERTTPSMFLALMFVYRRHNHVYRRQTHVYRRHNHGSTRSLTVHGSIHNCHERIFKIKIAP